MRTPVMTRFLHFVGYVQQCTHRAHKCVVDEFVWDFPRRTEFIGRMDELGVSYEVPRSLREVPSRMEENVVHFLPNYMRVIG